MSCPPHGGLLPDPLAVFGKRKPIRKMRVGDSFPLAMGRVTVVKVEKHVEVTYLLVVKDRDGVKQRIPGLSPDSELSGITRKRKKKA